jgi:hypothetical protein
MARHDARPRARGPRARAVIAAAVFVAGVLALGYVMLWMPAHGTEATSDAGASSSDAAATDVSAELSPRESLADYSWAELSRISSEVSACQSRDDALQVAERYNLVSDDGSMTGERKAVALDDGTSANVVLADVWHDDLASGGKAGLTFVFADAVATRPMNDTDTVEGGWGSSSMRSWLASELMDELPDDLAAAIVPISKATNNTGVTSDASAVTVTEDSLWLLSAREALGDITWYAQEYGSEYASYDTPANAEGEQYALFAQQGVTCDSDGSGALVRTLDGTPCSWFLRTCVPYQASWAEDAFFYDVMDSGHPGGMARPSEELGVVCGFCV